MGQAAQVAAPGADAKVPGLQGRHEADPLEGWYCPGGHPVQVGVSRPESLSNVPAAHMRQVACPALGWCLPGRHARQVADPF